jgi:glutathione S-transferase
MTLRIYGIAKSRTFRVLWMAHELGLTYEMVPISWIDGSIKSNSYLSINPNGLVPAIDDEGTVVWDSTAINLYLGRKYGNELWPATVAEEGRTLQWSFWAIAQLERPLLALVRQRYILTTKQRNAAVAKEAAESLAKSVDVLNRSLASSRFLLNNRFTVADLIVASVLYGSWINALDMRTTPTAESWFDSLDLPKSPNAAIWLDRCLARPAARKAVQATQ